MYNCIRTLALTGVCLTSTRDEFLDFCNLYAISNTLANRAVETVGDLTGLMMEQKRRFDGSSRLCFEGWPDVLRMLGNTVAIYYSRMRDGGFPKEDLQAHYAWKGNSWADELLRFEKSFLFMRHRSAAHVVNGIERVLLVLKDGKLSVFETHVAVTNKLFFTFFFVISTLNIGKQANVETLLSRCRNVSVQPLVRKTPDCILATEKLLGYILESKLPRAIQLVKEILSYQAQLRDLERAHCCFKLSYMFLESGRTKLPTVGLVLSYESFSALFRATSTGARITTVPLLKTWREKEKDRIFQWREDAFHSLRGPFFDYMYPCPGFDSDHNIRRYWDQEVPESIERMMEELSKAAKICAHELAQLVDLEKFENENKGYSWSEDSLFVLLEKPLAPCDSKKGDDAVAEEENLDFEFFLN